MVAEVMVARPTEKKIARFMAVIMAGNLCGGVFESDCKDVTCCDGNS